MKLFVDYLKPVTFRVDPRARYEGERDGSKADPRTFSGFTVQNVIEALDAVELPHTLCVDESDPEHLGLVETRMLPMLVRDMQKMAEEIRRQGEVLARRDIAIGPDTY